MFFNLFGTRSPEFMIGSFDLHRSFTQLTYLDWLLSVRLLTRFSCSVNSVADLLSLVIDDHINCLTLVQH